MSNIPSKLSLASAAGLAAVMALSLSLGLASPPPLQENPQEGSAAAEAPQLSQILRDAIKGADLVFVGEIVRRGPVPAQVHAIAVPRQAVTYKVEKILAGRIS